MSVVRVRCLKGKHGSSPPQVFRRLKDHIREEGLKPTDQAWVVVHKDQWTDDQLVQLHQWAAEQQN